jgi:hypothetical protein
MRFDATLLQEGRNATGIEVPRAIVEALGPSRKPAVTVSLNGFSYCTTVASMGGRFMLPVSRERREAAGLKAGDVVEVEIALDTEPREVVLPADFAAALGAEPEAGAVFDGLAHSHKQRHVLPIEAAATAETRARRIAKAIEALKAAGG